MKITVFYIIYYSFLTGFFMLMLLAFFATLYDDKPTWVGDSKGIIGTNPGWLNIKCHCCHWSGSLLELSSNEPS